MTLEPLIPYLDPKPLELWGPQFSIKPFGTLVALGVYIGTEIVRRKGAQYMLVGGFVGGHVLDSLFYHPDVVVRDPVSLLKIWAGQSSFGGFTGAFLGL